MHVNITKSSTQNLYIKFRDDLSNKRTNQSDRNNEIKYTDISTFKFFRDYIQVIIRLGRGITDKI